MLPKTEILEQFAKYIENQTGITYNPETFFQLESRLESIALQMGVSGMDGLWNLVLQQGWSGPFKTLLLDIATNNETSFFRDPGVFQAIKEHYLPAWLAAGNKHLRVWSAASSNGQEAYSLAMIFEEERSAGKVFDYQIVGTDISERVLKRAQSGRYSQLEVQRGLSAPRMIKFFREVPEADHSFSWEATPELKKHVSFSKMNLIERWPDNLGVFDLILCRNVLIYQKVEQKIKVINQLYTRLSPNGCLVLGGAESLMGLSEAFDQLNLGSAIFYKPKPQNLSKNVG